MGRHIEYGKYLFRHKWFVTLACFSRGMYWRGLVHDLSKFRPSEWRPYARYFYEKDGTKKTIRDKTGYYKPTDTGDSRFDFAWLLHQKRNKHHWQWWICPQDDGGFKKLLMKQKYLNEMVCDWIGAGRAQGVDDWQNPWPWYEINKEKIILADISRYQLETFYMPDKAED